MSDTPWKTINSLLEIPLDDIDAIAADIDYTLVDFDLAHKAGMEALAKLHGSKLAENVENYFRLILEGHRRPETDQWDKRSDFNDLMERIRGVQVINDEHPFKVWSREAFISLAAEGLNENISPEDLMHARDSYWQTLGSNVQLYSDAQRFNEILKKRGIPLILMTGSDSVLTIQPDGTLLYDPDFSDNYKRSRLSSLPVYHLELLIGDPIDKPHAEYFDRVEQALKKHGAKTPQRIVAVGDSPRSDLEVLVKRGYKGYHIKRL